MEIPGTPDVAHGNVRLSKYIRVVDSYSWMKYFRFSVMKSARFTSCNLLCIVQFFYQV